MQPGEDDHDDYDSEFWGDDESEDEETEEDEEFCDDTDGAIRDEIYGDWLYEERRERELFGD